MQTAVVAELTSAKSLLSENPGRVVLRRFLKRRATRFWLGFLILLFAFSLAAPLIAPFKPNEISLDGKFQEPLTRSAVDGRLHLLGTDHLGRDYFTRVVYAARVSLLTAVIVATMSSVIGILFGLIAGYFGGWISALLTRFTEFISTFPLLTILLILNAILIENASNLPIPDWLVLFGGWIFAIESHEARKTVMVICVIGLLSWTGTMRLTRGMVLSVREQPYVEAERALGASAPRILLMHILPNAYQPLLVDYTLGVSGALLLESALSFLGFGIQDPTPTWGNMLSLAQSYMWLHPWMPLAPGIPILLCTFAINAVGEALRDALDFKMSLT